MHLVSSIHKLDFIKDKNLIIAKFRLKRHPDSEYFGVFKLN